MTEEQIIDLYLNKVIRKEVRDVCIELVSGRLSPPDAFKINPMKYIEFLSVTTEQMLEKFPVKNGVRPSYKEVEEIFLKEAEKRKI